MAALEKILQQVKEGTLSIEEASLSLRKAPFVDLGYAQVDTQRGQRQGIPEVIYGAGKTAAQIEGIAQVLKRKVTVLSSLPACPKKKAEQIQKTLPLHYEATGRIGILGSFPEPTGHGTILILSAGTSDLAVAEEARLTAPRARKPGQSHPGCGRCRSPPPS